MDTLFPDTFSWTYSDKLDCYILCKLSWGQSWYLDTANVDLEHTYYKEEFEIVAEEFKLYGQNYYAMFTHNLEFVDRWTDSETRKDKLAKK